MSRYLLQALIIITVISTGIQGKTADFTILTENAPPTNYLDADSNLIGSSTEIVEAIMQRLGWSQPIQVLPWTRAYNMALKGPNIALFSTTRTEEREPLFKWVGPIFEQRQMLYKAAGSPIQIRSLDDARRVKAIGTYYNDAAEQYLKKQDFTNLASTPDDSLNIRKLVIGRIQLWATGDASIETRLKKAGFSPGDIEEAFELQKIELYIAFSRDTADEIIEAWQAALDELKAAGIYDQIINKYRTMEQ